MSVLTRRIDLSVGEATSGRNDRYSIYEKFKTTLFSRRRSQVLQIRRLEHIRKSQISF